MKQLTLTIAILGIFGLTTFAQTDDSWDNGDTWDNSGDTWDDSSYDYDGNGGGTYQDPYATDSATADDGGWDDGGWDDGGGDWGDSYGYQEEEFVRSARPKFERKPYERFTGMPYDSATELITYIEIVEVLVPDDYFGDYYAGEDSLYARGMKWMIAEFGEKEVKRMIEESGLDPKREGKTIKATAEIPLKVKINEYQTVDGGKLRFDIELRFKDERYRYKFNNFVHLETDLGGGKDMIETYMEYYLDAKNDIVHNDKVLKATNEQMTTMIDNLKKTCDATPFVDDDDW